MTSIRHVAAPWSRTRRIWLRAILSSFAFLAALPLNALEPDRAISQYAHRAWQIEDGLPHSVVRAVAQTDDG